MKVYFIEVGNSLINVFSNQFNFPNKEYILSLYDTDKEQFEAEVNKIKTKITINI